MATVGQHLLPQHQDLLNASAISSEVAEARGYRSMSSRYDIDTLKDAGFTKGQINIPGLLIPRHNLQGEQDGYQYRPDEPKEGRRKYESPKGQRNILDVNPLMLKALRSGKQVIFITEGARKIDALATKDIPGINVAGVFGWRGENEDGGITTLPDWEDIAIKDNIFVQAFDSDFLTKEGVHNGLSRLRKFLLGRRAGKVRVMVLPQTLSGKTGIDDYIAAVEPTFEDLAKLIVDYLPDIVEPQEKAEPVEVVPLADLLNMVAKYIRKYVAMPALQVDTAALWIAESHTYKAFDIATYLNPRSAEKRSGKTRLMEVSSMMVANPLKTDNISAAALARMVDQGATVLLDEVDTVFGKGKSVSETQESLRGIINSGFQRSGSYTRMSGQGASMEPQVFSTFGPKMLAGIGELPGTINDRIIPFTMKRRLDSEIIARFHYRDALSELAPIKDMLTAWAPTAMDVLRNARPEVMEDLDDRAFDSWEPLLAIADLAGGDWPERAWSAALALSGNRVDDDESRGVRLLSDIKYVFRESGDDRLPTKALLVALNAIEESPWGAYRKDKGLDGRGLARMLKPYEINHGSIRLPDGSTPKGYYLRSFEDAFPRYLGFSSATSATSVYKDSQGQNSSATSEGSVADETDPFTSLPSHVSDVADGNDHMGPIEGCGTCLGLRRMCSMHQAMLSAEGLLWENWEVVTATRNVN